MNLGISSAETTRDALSGHIRVIPSFPAYRTNKQRRTCLHFPTVSGIYWRLRMNLVQTLGLGRVLTGLKNFPRVWI